MDSCLKLETTSEPVALTLPVAARTGVSSRSRRLVDWLRDFPWLTRQRVIFYSGVLLLAYLVAAIGQLVNSHHLIVPSGVPVGGDFVDPYAASIAALHGNPAAVYDIHRQHLREIAILFGTNAGVWGFHYPPMYLLLVLPLSLLPYVWSWLMFETVTLAGYVAVLRRIAPTAVGLWLAITFPAVIINFRFGQNGFLTTTLMGGGLLLLESRPIVAGMLFGLMAYKPHFAVLIPLALIVDRRWRAFLAAAVSALLFAAASLAVFGEPTWRGFIASIAFTRKIVLEDGAIGFPTLQSMFGAIRTWGGSIQLAYVFQAAVATYAVLAVLWVWRTNRPFALKAATVAAGSLMVSPYVLQYDLVLLALPIGWIAMEGLEHGFLPFEKFALSLVWFMPRISLRISEIAGIPIAPIAVIGLMTLILRRVIQDTPEPAFATAPAPTAAPLPVHGWSARN
jgi:alpha-1,2-mannosyltransferase